MTDDEYHALLAAVSETEQGRQFLAAHLDHNRLRETTLVLEAAERLEKMIAEQAESGHAADALDSAAPMPANLPALRDNLDAMSEEIDRAKREIASIRSDGSDDPFDSASLELDAIVASTEEATSAILTSAEQIQELAWVMREAGIDDSHCDQLDAYAVEIYTCCAFQDLTGQRTQKVVNTLRFLEARIGAMRAIWGSDRVDALEGNQTHGAPRNDGDIALHGPALPGQGMEQTDIDALLDEAGATVPKDGGTESGNTDLSDSSMPEMPSPDQEDASAPVDQHVDMTAESVPDSPENTPGLAVDPDDVIDAPTDLMEDTDVPPADIAPAAETADVAAATAAEADKHAGAVNIDALFDALSDGERKALFS
ncbi:MAG: hypothetical protein AAFX39_08810 [Pseudomonadota bacterium]